jgi:hypothetical protein
MCLRRRRRQPLLQSSFVKDCSQLHLEGDEQGVVATVKAQNRDWSSMGMLVEDFKHELQSLQQWQLTFVRREGNQAAFLASKTFMNNT